jgi:hypothetical protein
MTELRVTLDFACCGCEEDVSVTVRCTGSGLKQAAPGVVAVDVPCPTCGQSNRLYFEPCGTVRGVRPGPARYLVPTPSLN